MRTTYYRVRVYVGPVHVAHYAQTARRAGMTDVGQGAEHVYATVSSPTLTTEGDRLVFRQRVADAVYDSPMAAGWRDVEIMG